ncbi:conjugative transposon protein TraJ [Sinomicrobium pectinilyticum]|uniref:Conjugative transposon protein TraJ n=1 Tax=Sinomicrobium pectinilyticum TaxID=1084421 RepID=A0A3N0EKY7_SINP1|nr:conjugative transposon protein TraJ [Sinomicrobium pectinilyticum]RNL88471.1 conjugative transposon protein TraJ [Sinomicrobium pectinilyticum]
MKISIKITGLVGVAIFTPTLSVVAQGSGKISGLHGVLQDLYAEMMPLCSQLIGVGRGIAGFAALWYIASRVWRHLANAESIDFYPLFRPFAIGLCIAIFPSVIGLINGIMQPTVTATSAMVQNSDQAIAVLLQKKEEAMRETDAWKAYVGITGEGDRDHWYRYTHDNANPSEEGFWEGLGNDIKFDFMKDFYHLRHSVKRWMSEVLQVIYEAAALCIDTLRTFQLIVLAILGPLVFGIAVFDGFQHTLAVWIARYLNVFLWLPIANIFGSLLGKIQEKMIELDFTRVQETGDTFFNQYDVAYLIFLIIGIVGYFTVPSMANYIIHAGGGSAFTQKVTNLLYASSRKVVSSTTAEAGMVGDVMGDAYGKISQSMAGHGQSSNYFGDNSNNSNKYMKEKLKGNT